ncbi:uncharacterized protein LOC113320802 isoform X2 [Papaver somniferum]|uniref:uncharacterized protein LOC113320802 isoform X2 n=1 Tax=Papaver somniferum TaxID=3469 RepID=UPI000E7059BF|nr:uncharacterized protein LOC113320802 isoform X2 [Papaver somniferum]
MLKKILAGSGSSSLHSRWRTITNRCSSTTTSVSSAVNSMLLRSLKEHYLEISKIEPPPKINPPNSFSVVKGAFESTGPVLKRDYDAIGIHSVSLTPKTQASQFLAAPNKYAGPTFQDLDQKMRDTLHGYIEERGINESLFCFLQSWLYVKDHRNGLKWFKAVGSFITKPKTAQDVPQ